jgi:hypothetical protein
LPSFISCMVFSTLSPAFSEYFAMVVMFIYNLLIANYLPNYDLTQRRNITNSRNIVNPKIYCTFTVYLKTYKTAICSANKIIQVCP